MLFTLNASTTVKSSQLTVRRLRCNNTQQPILSLLDVCLSCLSPLSSVIPHVLPKDSQEAGNRSGVITGNKGRKEDRK